MVFSADRCRWVRRSLLPIVLIASTGLSFLSRGSSNDPGSLAYHLATNAVARARGHAGNPTDMLILSNWSYAEYTQTNLHFLTNSVWSPQFWLYGVHGLAATAIGFSNGMGGQGLVTMVSPRHYLFSAHMHPEGYNIAFLDTNNVIHWRRTLQRTDLATDTAVGILNADLPPSVEFLPVLPSDYYNYLPTNSSSVMQGLSMNQGMLLFSQPMNFSFPGFVAWNPNIPIPSGLGTNWSVHIRGGDSSDPAMILIGNQLVLVSHIFGVQGGPNYATQISAINRAMHELSTKNHAGSDYQLTTLPLTNWPTLR